jgi:hypothetical protein
MKHIEERIPFSSPKLPYQIADGSESVVDLPVWLRENKTDPAIKVRQAVTEDNLRL